MFPVCRYQLSSEVAQRSGKSTCISNDLGLHYSSVEFTDVVMNIKTIDISALAQTIKIPGDYLVSRPVGRRFRECLLDELHCLSINDIAVLDFSHIDIMDASFADEVFVSIAVERGQKYLEMPPFVLSNLSETNRENLDIALFSRPGRETGVNNCGLLILKSGQGVELIGRFQKQVEETYYLLQQNKTLTAADVSELAKIGVSAASNRLKVIYDLGLVTREEIRDSQGKQFVYREIALP